MSPDFSMYYLQGAGVRKKTIPSDVDNTSSEYLVRRRLKVCLPNTGLLPFRAIRIREPCLIIVALSMQGGGEGHTSYGTMPSHQCSTSSDLPSQGASSSS